jgi:hypothetical protein
VNTPAQEGPGRDDDGPSPEPPPLQDFDAADRLSALVDNQPRNRSLDRLQRRMALEKRPHRPPVETTVALRTRGPDRRALAAVEHAELQGRQVGGSAHDAAQCIDFPNYSPFGNPTNRRIARHLANSLERTGDDANRCTESRGSDRGFGAGVTGANNEDVEVFFKLAIER